MASTTMPAEAGEKVIGNGLSKKEIKRIHMQNMKFWVTRLHFSLMLLQKIFTLWQRQVRL